MACRTRAMRIPTLRFSIGLIAAALGLACLFLSSGPVSMQDAESDTSESESSNEDAANAENNALLNPGGWDGINGPAEAQGYLQGNRLGRARLSLAWSKGINRPVHTVAASNGVIIVDQLEGSDSTFRGYSSESGEHLWSSKDALRGKIVDSRIHDESAYLLYDKGTVFRVKPADGEVEWRKDHERQIGESLFPYRKWVYSLRYRDLYRFNVKGGENETLPRIQDEENLQSGMDPKSLSIVERRIWLADDKRNLARAFAADPQKWDIFKIPEADHDGVKTPSKAPLEVQEVKSRQLLRYEKHLASLSAHNERLYWIHASASRILASALTDDEVVFCTDSKLTLLDRKKGELIREIELKAPPTCPPIVLEDCIIVADAEFTRIYRREDLKILQTLNAGGYAFVAFGSVYCISAKIRGFTSASYKEPSISRFVINAGASSAEVGDVDEVIHPTFWNGPAGNAGNTGCIDHSVAGIAREFRQHHRKAVASSRHIRGRVAMSSSVAAAIVDGPRVPPSLSLWALDDPDKELTKMLSTEQVSPPALCGDQVIVATNSLSNAEFIAFDTATLKEKWKKRLERNLALDTACPTIVRDDAIWTLVEDQRTIVRLQRDEDGRAGAVREFTLPSAIIGNFALHGNQLVALSANSLHLIDAETMESPLSVKVRASHRASTRLMTNADHVLVSTKNMVLCFDAGDFDHLWQLPVRGSLTSAMDKTHAFLASQSALLKVNLKDGSIAFSVQLDGVGIAAMGSLPHTMMVSDDVVVLSGQSSTLIFDKISGVCRQSIGDPSDAASFVPGQFMLIGHDADGDNAKPATSIRSYRTARLDANQPPRCRDLEVMVEADEDALIAIPVFDVDKDFVTVTIEEEIPDEIEIFQYREGIDHDDAREITKLPAELTDPGNRLLVKPVSSLARRLEKGERYQCSLTFRASDANAMGPPHVLTITILPPYERPILAKKELRLTTTPGIAIRYQLLAEAQDPEASLTFKLLTETDNGILELSPEGHFTYTPGPEFEKDQFTYEVYDGKGTSYPGKVEIGEFTRRFDTFAITSEYLPIVEKGKDWSYTLSARFDRMRLREDQLPSLILSANAPKELRIGQPTIVDDKFIQFELKWPDARPTSEFVEFNIFLQFPHRLEGDQQHIILCVEDK